MSQSPKADEEGEGTSCLVKSLQPFAEAIVKPSNVSG